LRILYLTPPAKTSNEIDLYRRMPDVSVLAIDSTDFDRGAEIRMPSIALPWLGSPERWTGAISWYRGLADVDMADVDIVLSSELYSLSSVQAVRLARRLGAVHVTVVWEILATNPLNHLPPWGLHRRYTAARTDHVIALTRHAADYAGSLGVSSDDLSVVHPGVDTGLYRPAASLEPSPTALFVGEMRPDKGVLEVLDAAERISGEVADFRLKVVGDGPLLREIRDLAASRPWLEVIGRVPREAVPELLRSSRILVTAPWSRKLWAEQFGYALVEAMACGLPVVTTRCGAIPEIVPPHNAVVNEHDVDGLVSGLRTAIGPTGAEWGRENRRITQEQYDLDEQARLMVEVLEAAKARGRKR
jgi:phosphatidylinositol alpha-1,6-mannosyltransferase